MMRLLTIVFSVICMTLFLPGMVFAGSTTAKIERILFYEGQNMIYIYPEGGVQNAPSCHTAANGDYYTMKMDRIMAEAYLSGLLTALATQKTVILRGYDACNEQSSNETLYYFTLVK